MFAQSVLLNHLEIFTRRQGEHILDQKFANLKNVHSELDDGGRGVFSHTAKRASYFYGSWERLQLLC